MFPYSRPPYTIIVIMYRTISQVPAACQSFIDFWEQPGGAARQLGPGWGGEGLQKFLVFRINDGLEQVDERGGNSERKEARPSWVSNAWCRTGLELYSEYELAVLLYSLSFIQFSMDTNRVLARSYTSPIQWKSILNKVNIYEIRDTKTWFGWLLTPSRPAWFLWEAVSRIVNVLWDVDWAMTGQIVYP